MLLKSIRFKIIFWYMLILTIILCLFSFFLYHNLRNILYSNNDELLLSKADAVADSMDTYWQMDRLGVLDKTNFTKMAQLWVEERSKDPKLMNNIVQIFDPQGNRIASSKNIPAVGTFSKEMLEFALKNTSTFDNLTLELSEGRTLSLRVFTMPIVKDNKIAYIVQAASTLDDINYVLSRLRIVLFIILPLTVFITGIAGAFFARLTLRPIDRMVTAIHRITVDNLEEKISVPNTDDEIKSLAETFNQMLLRLHSSFLLQKQFIQDVSHELKTPLTVLRGEIEIAMKKSRSLEGYESILRSNLEEINKISKIIEDLLNLARLDNREVKLELNSLELNNLLKETLEDIKILADQKHISLNFLPESKIIIDADRGQLRRAFLNILDNSVKYTADNGRILLETIKEGKIAKIKITDSGIGISDDDLPHIFDRFYRVDKSRSTPGSGLGLSIAKAIIETHNGAIEVKSRLAQGTSFIITLPLFYHV